MFYSMESTMAILPQICLIVLGVCLMMTELRGESPQTVSDLASNSEDEGFGVRRRNDFVFPPGELLRTQSEETGSEDTLRFAVTG